MTMWYYGGMVIEECGIMVLFKLLWYEAGMVWDDGIYPFYVIRAAWVEGTMLLNGR